VEAEAHMTSFTDSPVHDPYAATNGLLYSHCGWIFRKPTYPRMKMIERTDLEADPGKRLNSWLQAVPSFRAWVIPDADSRSGSIPAQVLRSDRPVLRAHPAVHNRLVGMARCDGRIRLGRSSC